MVINNFIECQMFHMREINTWNFISKIKTVVVYLHTILFNKKDIQSVYESSQPINYRVILSFIVIVDRIQNILLLLFEKNTM